VQSLARINSDNKELWEQGGYIDPFIYNPFDALKARVPNVPEILMNRNFHSCFYHHVSVDVDYNIYLCSELHLSETKVGNLKNTKYDISKIIQTSEYDTIVKTSSNEEKCNNCEFKYLCFHCYSLNKNMDRYYIKSFCNYIPEGGMSVNKQ
jgi:radical SAM protein with 4Fe4S-binding SPASM domain